MIKQTTTKNYRGAGRGVTLMMHRTIGLTD